MNRFYGAVDISNFFLVLSMCLLAIKDSSKISNENVVSYTISDSRFCLITKCEQFKQTNDHVV